MLMKTLAHEVYHHRLRINGIAPEAIRTAVNKESTGSDVAIMPLVPAEEGSKLRHCALFAMCCWP